MEKVKVKVKSNIQELGLVKDQVVKVTREKYNKYKGMLTLLKTPNFRKPTTK